MDLEREIKRIRKSTGIRQLAQLYIHCYLHGEFDKIRLLMQDDITYDVPNTGILNANPKLCTEITGTDKVIDCFRAYRSRIENPVYQIRNQFINKDTVYFDLLVHYDQHGAYICGGEQNGYYRIILPVNTVVKFSGQKAVLHMDYLDYSVVYQQIQNQTPRLA